MRRFRPVVAAVCLAVALMAALPASGWASRSSEQPSTFAAAPSLADRFVGSIAAWGHNAFVWLQALIAAEHGTIVQVAPPAPPPPGQG